MVVVVVVVVVVVAVLVQFTNATTSTYPFQTFCYVICIITFVHRI